MSEPSSLASAPRAEAAVLARHVRALEGERHPDGSPAALERALGYVADVLASRGCHVRREPFRFQGREFVNVVGEIEGSDGAAPRVLIGAHVDTVLGTPG